ncbi:MAG: TonB-dependent receptor [Bacteroidales bacterium]|nr:TonB-dependent receptor [Bacteroidales bacterium]
MRKLFLLMSFMVIGVVSMLAQTKTITGNVTGDDGLPIPGAAVVVKGTSTGTVTDFDGNYRLNVPADAETLIFTFVGMEPQEQAIAGRTTINVAMQPDSKEIDEVIVTAYGTSTKGTFTGSAAAVKAESIEKRQVTNVTEALSGMVAGVQVLSDNGQPGVASKVRIRGVGSINASSAPLYVVDGVPYDGDLSTLNTSDIESMTVLKDAASTALYGARGANGIIMITTKKGSHGKSKINFDAKWGVNSRSVKNYEVMTSPAAYLEKEFEAIYNNAIYNLKYDEAKAVEYANASLTKNSNGGNGYQIYTVPDGQYLIGANGKLNPAATLGYSDGKYFYTPDNWADEMFTKHSRQQYDLSISGSNNEFNYYGSFGYLNNEGLIDGSGFERYTTRLKADYQVYDWLKVGANFSFNHVKSLYPDEQDSDATSSSGNAFYIANMIAPIYPLYVRDANGEIMTNNGRKVYDYGTSSDYSPRDRAFMSIANPLGDLIYNKTEYLMDVLHATWFGEITPINGLTLSARYGFSADNTRYGSLGNTYMGQSASYGGTAVQEGTRKYGFDQQYLIAYNKTFADVHALDVTLGYDGYKYDNYSVWATGQNLYNPESYYVSNTIDQRKGGGSRYGYATEGYFARFNYSYAGKYIGNVAYRRDASSRFSEDNRWGDFWSASAAWLISDEDFMTLDAIDMLKFKASVGQQGNDNLGDRYGYQYFPYEDHYTVGGANGVFSDGALLYKGNNDLTWETSTTYNLGLEFALLNNMISGSVEYFGRKSSDMLYYKPVAGSLGYSEIPMNIGSMTNSGVEIDLNVAILDTDNISWDFNVNATFIKNKINELHPDLNGQLIDGSRIYEEGKSMYRLYMPKWAGVEEETGLPMWWAKDNDGNSIKTTEFVVASENKEATKDLLPKVSGGFGTTVEAFGFDFSAQAAYQLGGYIYDSGYARLMHAGHSSYAGTNWHKDIYKSWTPENTKTDVPRVDAGVGGQYANRMSDRFLTKSNYLALNNLTLGYTLPKSLTEKVYINKFRVYVAADNVALLTARKGMDPRQSYTSTTTALYTPIRTISGGISLTF